MADKYCIYEHVFPNCEMIAGDIYKKYGKKDVLSGVGISFGADRIYDVLKGLDKFPSDLTRSTRVLFAVMGGEELRYTLSPAKALREAGVSVEVYPEAGKLKKQFDYAARKNIPFISINGSEEIAAGTLNFKNLQTGEQKAFAKDDLSGILAFIG